MKRTRWILTAMMITPLMLALPHSAPAQEQGERDRSMLGGPQGEGRQDKGRSFDRRRGDQPGDNMRRHKAQMHRILRSLDLSQEQRQQIREALEADREARQEKMAQMREQMQDIHKQMREARQEKDAEKVSELRKQRRELLDEGKDHVEGVVATIRALLTPEQAAQFDEKVQALRDDMRDQWVKRHGGPVVKALTRLDLSDEQQEKVKSILKSYEGKFIQWRQDHEDQIEALREEVRQAIKDRDREKLKELQEQARQMRESHPGQQLVKDVSAILNEEQAEKFEKAMDRARQSFRERMRDRREGGQGREGRGEKRRGDRDQKEESDELDF